VSPSFVVVKLLYLQLSANWNDKANVPIADHLDESTSHAVHIIALKVIEMFDTY